MRIGPEEQRQYPPAKLLAIYRAEMEARLSALEGGGKWEHHLDNIKWLAAAIFDLEADGVA